MNILNEENQGLVVKIKELEEKYRNDFAKFEEDLSYYRSSYDEQKERIDREHELISSSLYELALQFMNLNGELNKRNQNNVNKSWLEMERSKNFPTEKF